MKTLIVVLVSMAALTTTLAQAPGITSQKISVPQPKVFIFKKKTSKFLKNF